MSRVRALARRRPSALLLPAAACGLALYLAGVPHNPPGFFADESSIAYNAHLVATTGADEHGAGWPLFFRAFGEYKSPVYVYLLAAVYAVAGPSITAARALSALMGVAAAFVVGLVAARAVGRAKDLEDDATCGARATAAGLAVMLSALLTPWLFEVSRLVFEVALMPLALGLLLLALQRARERGAWAWRDSLSVAGALALVTYTYSVGRLLAPLLALGLLLFARRGGLVRAVLRTWLLYAATLAPLLAFVLGNPGALGERFAQVSFVRAGMTWGEVALRFCENYALAFSPWSWLLTGDPEPRHHVQASGSLLAATVAAAIAGLVVVLRRHRRDPFWRFVLYGLAVAPLPAALTLDHFHTLRLIALPVFLLTLAAPAFAWLAAPGRRSRARRAALAAVLLLTLAQGAFFVSRFHAEAPRRRHSFDAFYPEIFRAAAARPERPVHVIDNTGAPGYIHAYWYATLEGMDPARDFVRLPKEARPPPGALVISTELPCASCDLLLQRGGFRLYVAK